LKTNPRYTSSLKWPTCQQIASEAKRNCNARLRIV
jgi:hypothetical protein